MNLSDSIQIIQIAPDSLQVYFPPRLAGGIFSIVIAIILAFVAMKMHDTRWKLGFSAVLILFFLFLGLDLCTYRATVTLSGQAQTFAYEEKTFYYRTAKSFPLSALDQAVVRSGTSQNQLLSLLVESQPRINLGDGFNSRDNNFEAAQAINSFIAHHARK